MGRGYPKKIRARQNSNNNNNNNNNNKIRADRKVKGKKRAECFESVYYSTLGKKKRSCKPCKKIPTQEMDRKKVMQAKNVPPHPSLF